MTGKAKAIAEGQASISISNKINAASAVQISKVETATLREQNKELSLNIHDASPAELDVRVKLFLGNSNKELLPITEFNGAPIIEQNVDFKCVSEKPDYIKATGIQNDFDGFFCRISDAGGELTKDTPRRVGISIIVGSQMQHTHQKYERTVARFEVALTGEFVMENKFDKEKRVILSLEKPTQVLKLLSLEDFTIINPSAALKVTQSRESHSSNQYNLSIQLKDKRSATAFDTELTLTSVIDPDRTKTIPIRFSPKVSPRVAKEPVKVESRNDTK